MRKGITKVAFLVLAIAMIVSGFVACAPAANNAPSSSAPAESSAVASSSAPAESSAASSAPAEKGKIVYANKSLAYYFFVVCQEGVKHAAESLGYSFDASVAEFDSAKQTSQFTNFIAQKPAAIISDPIDSEGLIDVVNKSVAAGVPVGIIDTPTSGGKVAVTVAFDNKIAGQMAAEEIVKALKAKYGEEKGIVVNVYGAMSSWAWRLRKEGFDEVMAKYPKIQYLPIPGEGDMTKTHDAIINTLAKYPNIDAVHCPSDTPARGMMEALKQEKKWFKVGEKGHVIFVTIDGEPIANQMLTEGYYDGTIVQDAVSYSAICVELLDKYTLKGQDVPLGDYTNDKYFWKTCKIVDSPSGPYVAVPPYVMTPENAADPKHWGNVAVNEWGIKYE